MPPPGCLGSVLASTKHSRGDICSFALSAAAARFSADLLYFLNPSPSSTRTHSVTGFHPVCCSRGNLRITRPETQMEPTQIHHACLRTAVTLSSAFVEKSYAHVKKANPDLPILIRECQGTPARAYARFGECFSRRRVCVLCRSLWPPPPLFRSLEAGASAAVRPAARTVAA